MEPRISMITLGVSDLEESVNFYELGLGLPKMDSPPGTAFFTLNGTWLGLYPRDLLAKDATVPSPGDGFSGITLSHNVTSEAKVETVIRQAVEAGAKLVKPPQRASWGGFSGYFEDQDGHLWEVAYNPHFWIGPESHNSQP
jgi:catechol 2,3-dioxygenase-like lactoylglutathione lyase family enzyme